MYNLDLLLQECIEDLNSLGVEVGTIMDISVNTRLTSVWGRCRYNKAGVYYIEINQILMNEFQVSKQAIINTVMHETIHTVKGCMNHGTKFKNIAALVNNFYGYDVKRCTSAAEKNLQDVKKSSPILYTIKCQNCGGECGYRRETKVVKAIKAGNLAGYCCGSCRSKKLIIKK